MNNHISTGDLVRDEIRKKTRLGIQIEEYSNPGKLIPDEIVLWINWSQLSLRLLLRTISSSACDDTILDTSVLSLVQSDAEKSALYYCTSLG